MDAGERIRGILAESMDRDNPDSAELEEMLASVNRIAVVGISRNPDKPARRVPSYMATKGYEVIPVNPFVDRILGKEALDSLAEVTEPVDMVLVFRPSDEAATVIAEAMARPERPVIWLQEGIRADEVAARARNQGLQVVQDLCIYKIHRAIHPD